MKKLRFLKKDKQKGNFAFIDSQNLNLGTQKVGWKIDWQKFLHYLQTKHNVKTAYLFIGYMQENEEMYKQLYDIGYLVVLKPTVELALNEQKNQNDTHNKSSKSFQRQKSAVKASIKGNVDAELVLYALKEMPKYREAVIVSGDGDFYCLAEYLEQKNKLQAIMAPNKQYSSLLKPFEKYIIRIDKLRQQLEHIDYKSKK